jgi:replicative DNA helicase
MTKRKGANRYPELSDLRESGSLEQDADAVMFLHRDWPMGIEKDEQGNSTEFEADLLIRKWRNGKLGHIAMEFSGPMMMFKERIKTGFVPYND